MWLSVLTSVGQVHMQVVRAGVEALHFVASDFEWPSMDQNGRLENAEGSSVGPEVSAFHTVAAQEAKERRELLVALKEGEEAVLPPLPKSAATARQNAHAKFAEVMGKVRAANVVSDVFPKELLDTMDKAFRSLVRDRLGLMADTTSVPWMEALRGYQTSIRVSCKKYWSATLAKLRETAPDSSSIRALENAPHKLEWVFELQRLGLAFALPFPTQTFMGDLRTALVEADTGIQTVSTVSFWL